MSALKDTTSQVNTEQFRNFIKIGDSHGLGTIAHLNMIFNNHAAFSSHDSGLANVLVEKQENIFPGEVKSLIDDLADSLLEETIASSLVTNLTQESIQQTMDFQTQAWSCLSATMGRLAYMNGLRSPNLDELIAHDDLSTNPNGSDVIVKNKELFPECTVSHQIIATEQKVREVFNQWKAGGDPQSFSELLGKYYQQFKFDEATAHKYTDQSELGKIMFDQLSLHLKEHPLSKDARIAIIGPGARPFELEIIKKLIDESVISVSQIHGIDMQNAQQLGLSDADLAILRSQNYTLQGGQELGDWVNNHIESEDDQYDMTLFCGSVNNNNYNQLEPLKDFLNISRLLRPDGLLVYDTASFEHSPAHLAKFKELFDQNPNIPEGARKSAQFEEFIAFIFPQHIIDLYLELGGIEKVVNNVWEVDENKSRLFLIGKKSSDRVTVLGRLLESLLTSAFSDSSPRPSPVEEVTAWWRQDQGAELIQH